MSASDFLLYVAAPPIALAIIGWLYALLNPWMNRHGW